MFLNCTPPWMSEAEDDWCREKFLEIRDEADEILDNIINNIVSAETKESCPSPCRQTMWGRDYQSSPLSLVED